MSASPADQDDVRTLLEQCVTAWHEQGPRAAEALLEQAPELASPVRDGLAALARAGLLDAEDAPELPERIGGYRVLALLGRGGMGAVFHARDDAAGRDVAVKVVHPQLLWYGRARERFEREIRALARLRHRGAVPVFHFGDDAGVPYFVMEYVPGRSLAQVLAGLSGRAPGSLRGADLHDGADAAQPWWRAVVGVMLQVADTLHHAHQLGIVHRDVKPSNVLVTSSGEARLVDFGLARVDGDPSLTRLPTTIGSEPYLAPEQCTEHGGRADARSDVFSLGATLYEALTLRPPFGTGGPRTRERILAGDHVPLRSAVPGLARDLAAVVAVAIDPEPARRHATAGAFADDLRAVLAGRPVAARPIGWCARLLRLALRHRIASAAVVTALLLVVAAPTAFAWQQYESSRQTQAALQRAVQNRDRALEAIDRLLARVAQERLFDLPEAEGARRRLLLDAIEVQEAMLRESPDDAQVVLDVAVGKRRLSELHGWLGDEPAAARCIDEALVLLRGTPGMSAIELARALAIHSRGNVTRGDTAGAEADLREALGALERERSAPAAADRSARLERTIAERRIDLAIVEGMRGKVADAERGLAEALATLRALPENRNTLQAVGRALLQGALPAVQRNDNQLAASLAAGAFDAYGRALELDPGDWELRALQAHAQTDLAKICHASGDAARGLEHGEAAHATLVTLHAAHPQVAWLTHQLAQCGLALADAYQDHGREQDARVALDDSIGMLRELLRAEPRKVQLRESLGLALGMRSLLTTYVHEAQPLLDEAQQLFEDLQREDAGNALAWRQLVVVYASQASLRRTAEDLEGEAKWLDDAIATTRPWVESNVAPATEILAALLLDRADCAARGADAELAREFVRESLALRRAGRSQLQRRPGLAPLLATPAFAELLK
ncbi:MAG TPA: serine/threonine-protein kinase [Planctomycetota bacterium]|nr:serine/threonine-protein kinase [Planctomycetota bacterium]